MPTTSESQRVQCTGCKAGFKLKTKYIGRNVKCPKCQTAFKAIAIKERPSQTAKPSSATQPKGNPTEARSTKAPNTPPGTRRCDMCHEFVPLEHYDEHRQSHEGTQEDGQLNEYPTLPQEQQYQGSLSDIPQWYVHSCGHTTGMPEEIIRTYLVNPYFYGYRSYCSGCQTHVPAQELTWESTDENLMDYTRKLQSSVPNAKKYRNQLLRTLILTSLVLGLIVAILIGGITYFTSSLGIALTVFLLVGIITTMGTMVALINMRGGI